MRPAPDETPDEGSRLQSWLGLDRRELAFAAVMAISLATYLAFASYPPKWWHGVGASLTGISNRQFQGDFFGHVAALVFIAIVPGAYLLAVERLGPRDLGLGLKGSSRMFVLVLVALVAMLPLLWLVVQRPDVAAAYPRLRAAAKHPEIFATYHAVYGIKWFAWEFYFRGALLFGARRHFGTGAAVLLSTLPYTVAHLGKPLPELYGSLFFGLLLCGIALRGKSIWPAITLHWGLNIALELMLVKWL